MWRILCCNSSEKNEMKELDEGLQPYDEDIAYHVQRRSKRREELLDAADYYRDLAKDESLTEEKAK